MKALLLKFARWAAALFGLWSMGELCISAVGEQWVLSRLAWRFATIVVSPGIANFDLVRWLLALTILVAVVYVVAHVLKEIEYLESR